MGMHTKGVLGIVLMGLLPAACTEGPVEVRSREGVGGKTYGGVFNINEAAEVRGCSR